MLRPPRSRALSCEVSDGSLTTPRIRRAAETDEGGRGLRRVAGPDCPDALPASSGQVA